LTVYSGSTRCPSCHDAPNFDEGRVTVLAYQRVGIVASLTAILMDLALLLCVSAPIYLLVPWAPQGETQPCMIVIVSIWLAYPGLLWAFSRGQTIGMRRVGIRMVRRGDLTAVGFVDAAYRVGAMYTLDLVFWPLTLPVFLLGREHRTLSDRFAGTVVVEEKIRLG
jgi:uncharacterized RDD family membrane protein YckC